MGRSRQRMSPWKPSLERTSRVRATAARRRGLEATTFACVSIKGHSEQVDVTLDFMVDEGCAVKIQGDSWEVNVCASPHDLLRLRDIRLVDWNARTSIAVGRAAGSPVFWCSSGGNA